MQGKVVATGPGKLLDGGERAKPAVKKGDLVVFGKYSGTETDIAGFPHYDRILFSSGPQKWIKLLNISNLR